ncbi:hypothetical protein [Nocardioides sp. S5]|uniref:hypothetical protein n=1 Tax=Nocardioides sp. S5 TaxID=2017486 RepID=UPI001A8DCD3C|nr:hypothetical protein [Nocardioides sp. S5]
MTRAAILIASLVASCALVSLPGPIAHAATASFGDPADDVAHGMDVRRVHVRNEDRFVVTVRHDALQEDGSVGVYIDVTPQRRRAPDYLVSMNMFDGRWFEWMSSWGEPGGSIRCPYTTRTNWSRNTTRFSISRRCLNGASFEATTVRVSAVAGVADGPVDWAPGAFAWSQWVARG